MLLLGITPAMAMPEIMTTEQIKPGMQGYAETMVQGNQKVRFNVEIMGVVNNGGGSYKQILARAYGDLIDDTNGVIHGMSGSPVYVDGKLIGAVARSVGQDVLPYKFYITPVEEMMKIWQMPDPLSTINKSGVKPVGVLTLEEYEKQRETYDEDVDKEVEKYKSKILSTPEGETREKGKAQKCLEEILSDFEVKDGEAEKLQDDLAQNTDTENPDEMATEDEAVKDDAEEAAETADDGSEKETAQAEVIVDPDGPKLEFVVLSDTHVQSGASSSSAVNFDSGLNDIVTTMPEVKTVINCGDFSSDGADGEFARYYAILDEYDEDLQFLNALGNHDVRWTSMGWEDVRERYMDYNQKYMNGSEEVYHDMWIGEGEDQYHFIVLNTEWDLKDSSYLSDEQLNWLDETMAEGAEEGKPIFVALHEPLRNSIANTDSDQGESDFPLDEGAQDFALKEILRKYPQTVLFTGHVHAGLGANEIIERDYGTQVNVPSFLRADSGEPQNQLGYHVAVYEDRVQLSLRDFEHDTWCAEGGYTIDLTDEAVPGKVLDIPFDDESASDVSGHGHDGAVYGDVEYVDGVEGKAIRLRNDPAALSASQYVDLGPLHFGEDDFTIMFWYKGTEEMDTEGAVLANKDWTTGGNQGLAIGTFTQPRPGIGLNFTAEGSSRRDTERYASATDGEWHHIAATVDRDGMMALYVDGQLCEEVDISADEGKRIDVDQLPLILGADGRKQYPVNDACIDELKIYRYAIEAYELESVRGPYRISAGQDSAVLSWEALDDRFCPAYVLFDGEQISVSTDAHDVMLDGLAPGREYTVEVITRDRAYEGIAGADPSPERKDRE